MEPNEEVTLDSGKQAEEGENLSYIWYDFNDSDKPEEITEATGQPTYKLIADHNKKIRCEVTKDGQTIFAKEFTVTVNTGLEIESDDDYENYGEPWRTAVGSWFYSSRTKHMKTTALYEAQ